MAPRKARRFFLKITAVVIVLMIALVIWVESGLATRFVLRAAGNRLGLEITAERVRIDLGGSLRLSRLAVALEDDTEPFFTVRQLSVSMHSLGELITTLDPNITEVRLVAPTLTLHSDQQGHLNIAPLLARLKDRPERPKRTQRPRIPDVSIIEGTFHWQQAGKDPLHIGQLRFKSAADEDGQLHSTLTLPGNNIVESIISLDTLSHRLTVHIEDLAALPSPANTDTPLTVQAQWDGHIAQHQPWRINGNLDVQKLTFGDADAALRAAVVIEPTGLTADLEHVSLDPWSAWPNLHTSPEAVTAAEGVLSVVFETGQIALKGLKVLLLDGETTLETTIFANRLHSSSATMAFQDIRPSALLSAEAFQDTRITGEITVEPATDRRAMEQMALALRIRMDGAVFEAAGLGQIVADGYFGPTRLVTQNVTIPVFDGIISPWISLTRRESEVFAHVITELNQLDINQLAHTFNKDSKSVPGRLSGTVRCRTSGDLNTLSGSADIQLTNSDLMQTRIIGAVYSAMNLSLGEMAPKGHGTIKLAAQAEKLEVMSFEYFNRGVEVRGAGAIEAVTQGNASPISGFVTGSVRPLHRSRIPGTRELDQIIKGLQAGLASVKIEGTLGQPEPRIVTMTEIRDAFRALLQLQLKE